MPDLLINRLRVKTGKWILAGLLGVLLTPLSLFAAPVCYETGIHDAAPPFLQFVPSGQWVANAYTSGPCGNILTEIGFYCGSSGGSVEVALYEGTNMVFSGLFTVPASSGWVTIATPPIQITCGSEFILALHPLSDGFNIGRASAVGCRSDSDYVGGLMPSPFPEPGILVAANNGPCYETYMKTCNLPTPTPTDTFTTGPTATSTDTPGPATSTDTPGPTATSTDTPGPTDTPMDTPTVTATPGPCEDRFWPGHSLILGNISPGFLAAFDQMCFKAWMTSECGTGINPTFTVVDQFGNPVGPSFTLSGPATVDVCLPFTGAYATAGPLWWLESPLCGGFDMSDFRLRNDCLGTATPTSTHTPTPTFTRTLTPTFTRTFTRTVTPTFTSTNTSTVTTTTSRTFTATSTATRTSTPTQTRTFTRTETSTNTPCIQNIACGIGLHWDPNLCACEPDATSTRTATPTRTVTATPTVTRTPSGNNIVSVGVYNEAGELVKWVYTQTESAPCDELGLVPSTVIDHFQGIGSKVDLYCGNDFVGSWDGTNALGDPISNGTYFLKAVSQDIYGSATGVTKTVTVQRVAERREVRILNSAGEVVRRLYTLIDDPGGESMTSLLVSSQVLQPGGGIPSVQIVLVSGGSSVTLAWDGETDQGTMAVPGYYLISAHWEDGVGLAQDFSRGMVVTGSKAPEEISALPNLLEIGKGIDTTSFSVLSGGSWTLKVRVYSAAGEWVAQKEGVPGSNLVTWKAVGVASGLYFAEVEAQGPNSLLQRKVLKVAVLR